VAPPTLAFAGSGRITSLHGLAAQALGLPVVAVASRHPDHAQVRAEQLGARACGYDELPAGADLVVVATPPAHHAADALRCLERGTPVLVEKPLCTTLADADRLVAASLASRLPVLYAENLAFAPIVEQALAHIGRIGALSHLEARSVQPRPDWGDFLTDEWGGGVLFDLGVHPLALVLLAMAPTPPVEVVAELTVGADHPVDDRAQVRLRFEGGLEASVLASWQGTDVVWDLQAASDQGVVRAELLPNPGLERDGEPAPYPPTPRDLELPQLLELGYIGQLEAAARHLARPRPDVVDVTLGRQVLEVVCAAYRSAGRGGAPEPLPFRHRRDRTPLSWWRDPMG
jgi:myo-inositol 2-dehydrogenase/D-chiro-inositol 1-dehydrogenase